MKGSISSGSANFARPDAPLLETVPNLSVGPDSPTVERLARILHESPGVCLLDQTSDADHVRTVFTAVASPPPLLVDATFALIAAAVDALDIRVHTGVHPRVGVADVVPFVPIRGLSLDAAAGLATQLAKRVGNELGVPVYLYEAAAHDPLRADLPTIRNRGWEYLETVIESDPFWTPDFGPARLHPTAGACVIGARPFLIAYNINLATTDLRIAKAIAKRIRATTPGGLPGVRALGLPQPRKACVQVSVNLVNYAQTSLGTVFDWVERLATTNGVKIREGELVGLIPHAATLGYDIARLKIPHWSPDMILENRIASTCV